MTVAYRGCYINNKDKVVPRNNISPLLITGAIFLCRKYPRSGIDGFVRSQLNLARLVEINKALLNKEKMVYYLVCYFFFIQVQGYSSKNLAPELLELSIPTIQPAYFTTSECKKPL